jgi:hypothetical protein
MLIAVYLIYLYQHPIWEGRSKNWSARYYYSLPTKTYTGYLYWQSSKKITVNQTTLYENNKVTVNSKDKINVTNRVNFVELDDPPSDKTALKVLVKWKDRGKHHSDVVRLYKKRLYKPYYIFDTN